MLDMEKIIREYIDKSLHLSLATCANNQPWVCEVHFVYDENLNLYFRSLPTTRHSQEIAQNPRVAGNIVRQHGLEEVPHAIYFEGTATMLADEQEVKLAFPLFRDKLGASEDVVQEAQQPDGHKFYKITVEDWYAFGKFDFDKVGKYQLAWHGGEAA